MKTNLIVMAIVTAFLLLSGGCGDNMGGSRAQKVGSAGQSVARSLSGHPDGNPGQAQPGPASKLARIKPFQPDPEELVAVLPDAMGPLAFSPDNRTLVTCKPGSHALLFWDLTEAQPKIRDELTEHGKPLWAVAFAPDGKTLASAGVDDGIRIWDVSSGKPALRAKLALPKSPLDSLGWTPDGKTLVFSGGDDKRGGENWTVYLYDVTNQPREIFNFNGGTPIAIAPDGKSMASAWAVEVQLWDWAKGQPTKHAGLQGHQGTINALAFSPDSKLLVSVGRDRHVRLWDVAAEDERALCEAHNGEVQFVSWAPDGTMFATSGETNPARVVVWDRSGKKLKEWSFAGEDLYGSPVAFSPDSRRLAFPAATAAGRSVYIVSVRSTQLLSTSKSRSSIPPSSDDAANRTR